MCCILLCIMTNQEYCTIECEDLQIAVLMNCVEAGSEVLQWCGYSQLWSIYSQLILHMYVLCDVEFVCVYNETHLKYFRKIQQGNALRG